MKCYECKGSVSFQNIVGDKRCPSCGANLMRVPPKEVIRETLVSFAEDRGYIFWSLVYIVVISLVSFFNQFAGNGGLFSYITEYKARFIFYAFFSGMILDYVMKANVEVTSVRNKFIFKPPMYLRAFRRWTNIAMFIGLLFPLIIMTYSPGHIFSLIEAEYLIAYTYPKKLGVHLLTAYTFLPAFILCLFWAILGMFLSEKDMDDKRIRYFMTELRVARAKYLNRASAIYIGGLFVAVVIYYKLINISGLWWYIENNRLVYNIMKFFRDYFSWVHKFID